MNENLSKLSLVDAFKKRLIVSCQALEDEPLYGADIMAKMAVAAEKGGAAAIRANSIVDIKAIRQAVNLPIIGLIKSVYSGSSVYITPTMVEVNELIEAGIEVLALDCTHRERPHGEKLEDIIKYIKSKHQLIMADVSTFEEGVRAEQLGVDFVSTTMSGYTAYSSNEKGPDFSLVRKLVENVSIPVICEGKIWTPEDAKYALELGAHAVVIGSAITRPQLITERFVEKLRL
ncbi:N-acetylmannosamine-6-phosphate 2-epimerase [Priestia megaterium]|uniref:N-acetylmannosamine-6-phosphate 2-epimerase n=1 Tax=Priestia megaterium TaxID=1404 RepID=UPI000BF70451|nr:N-acetylmannosamine-6-phosphate 2-epimerase [Priestia megaterium]PFL64396.1 N-acetylmannosamine-6-phosphate 2-epimerase [Priestia megaterium]